MALKARSIGSTEAKSAVREFTDRVEPRQAFWNLYDNMEAGDIALLSFYGAGGVGKTALLEKIMQEMDEKKTAQNGATYKYARYDFNNLIHTADIDMREILYTLKLKLSALGCDFPLFEAGDFYFALMQGQKNIDPPKVKTLMEKSALFSKLKDFSNQSDSSSILAPGLKVAASFLNFADSLTEIAPPLKIAKSLLGFIDTAATKIAESQKGLVPPHSVIKEKLKKWVGENDPRQIYDFLPTLFAQDVCDWMQGSGEKLVIFLDSYELIAQNKDNQQPRDLWLRNDDEETPGMMLLIPNVLWVISGRNKLRGWGRDMDEALEQHLIERLSPSDSDYFLTKAGVASETLRAGIIDLTGGLPLYLDLCVDTYESYQRKNDGQEPDISLFGEKQDEIVGCMVKNMDSGTQDMLRYLCALKSWTDEMAAKILPSFSPTIYETQIKNFSFVHAQTVEKEDFSETVYRLDRVVQEVLFAKFHKESAYIYKDIRDRSTAYFQALLEKTEAESDTYDYYLERWADCVARLTDDAEELLQQYKEYFLKRVNELSWRDQEANRYVIDVFFSRMQEIGESESIPYAFFEWKMGKVFDEEYKLKAAYNLMDSAFKKFENLVGLDDTFTIELIKDLMEILYISDRFLEFIELSMQYIHICQKKYGKGDQRTIEAMKDLTIALCESERYDEALKISKNTLEILMETHKTERISKEILDEMVTTHNILMVLGRNNEAKNIEQQLLLTIRNVIDNINDKEEPIDDSIDVIIDIMKSLFMGSTLSDDQIIIQKSLLEICKKKYGYNDNKTIMFMIDFAEKCLTIGCKKYLELGIKIAEEVYDILIKEFLEDQIENDYYPRLSYLAFQIKEKCPQYNGTLINDILNIIINIQKKHEATLGKYNKQTIESLSDIAHFLHEIKRYKDELNIRKSIMDRCIHAMGYESEETLSAMDDYADSLFHTGHLEDELKVRQDILSKKKLILGADDSGTVLSMYRLADTFQCLGNYSEALQLLKIVYKHYQDIYGNNDPYTIEAIKDMATAMAKMQQYDDSIDMLRKIVDLLQSNFGETHSKTILAKIELTVVMHSAGKYTKDEETSLILSLTNELEKAGERQAAKKWRKYLESNQ